MVDPVSGAELDLADKILPSKATERSGTYPLYWPLIPGLTNMQLIRLQSLSSLLASIPGLTNIQLISLQSLSSLLASDTWSYKHAADQAPEPVLFIGL